MPAPPHAWTTAAASITPCFEISGADPYVGVAGDFDGMGISCGALQWNIGKGSLQPMVQTVGKPTVVAAMPQFGNDMWNVCNTTIGNGLAIVRGWQAGTTLKAKPKAELRTLMGTPAMRAQQRARIDAVAQKAFDRASEWATGSGKAGPSKRLFCWFFDLTTQNGGLKGLTPQRVAEFVTMNQPDRVDDLICDYLVGLKGTAGHIKDAHNNSGLWRNPSDPEKLEILVMSYLRSEAVLPQWRHVVLNRKGTIALGTGWVNSEKWNFSEHGL